MSMYCRCIHTHHHFMYITFETSHDPLSEPLLNAQIPNRLPGGQWSLLTSAIVWYSNVYIYARITDLLTLICCYFQQYFSINLDAVYLTSLGTRFYQLSTTDRFRRNRFIIDVTMTFADRSRANFKSEPFLVRSRKQSPNPRKKRSNTQ